jgi:hypothetical protein
LPKPGLLTHQGEDSVFIHFKDRCIESEVNPFGLGHLQVTMGVFGPGELFLEFLETEARVNALAENASGFFIPVKNHQVLETEAFGFHGGRKTGRPCTDDRQINVTFLHHKASGLKDLFVS